LKQTIWMHRSGTGVSGNQLNSREKRSLHERIQRLPAEFSRNSW
jgi:hypothetical protein